MNLGIIKKKKVIIILIAIRAHLKAVLVQAVTIMKKI